MWQLVSREANLAVKRLRSFSAVAPAGKTVQSDSRAHGLKTKGIPKDTKLADL